MSNVKTAMSQAAAAGVAPDGPWDLSYASYDGSLNDFSVAAQDGYPRDIFFKPDGTKMYVLGQITKDIFEYDLSTAWTVSTASYLRKRSLDNNVNAPKGVFFKPDGTKMYVVGTFRDDVSEFNLSTAWNVATASYVRLFSLDIQDTAPMDVSFKPDGTKMYVVGLNGDNVYEYDLSTAWDVSTTSYLQNFSVATEDTAPSGLFFKPDGTKMYVLGDTGDDVNEYGLSTAWDVSTASYLQNFSVATEDTNPQGLFFKPDGTKMYVVGYAGDKVYQYSLGV